MEQKEKITNERLLKEIKTAFWALFVIFTLYFIVIGYSIDKLNQKQKTNPIEDNNK
jgi:hypothetical protein